MASKLPSSNGDVSDLLLLDLCFHCIIPEILGLWLLTPYSPTLWFSSSYLIIISISFIIASKCSNAPAFAL